MESHEIYMTYNPFQLFSPHIYIYFDIIHLHETLAQNGCANKMKLPKKVMEAYELTMTYNPCQLFPRYIYIYI